MKKRVLSILLAVCMVFSLLPTAALVEGPDVPLCENHKPHNENCGYQEAVGPQSCTHTCALFAVPSLLISGAAGS